MTQTCEYHGRPGCPTCYPADIRARLALAIFRATRGRRHPANGGQHWNTARLILEEWPELRTALETQQHVQQTPEEGLD